MAEGRPARVARWVLTVAIVVYLCAVVWLTLGPAPGDEVTEVGHQLRSANATVSDRPAPSRDAASASDDVGFGLSAEEAGNVLLFVPMPVLVALRWPRWWWAGLPAAVAGTGAIELAQLWLLDHRSPEWNDFRWNSVGAVAGFVLWLAGSLAVGGARRFGRNPPDAG